MGTVSYTESKWVKGDVISSARLNNIEKGVLEATKEINQLELVLGPSATDGPIKTIPENGFGTNDYNLITAAAIASARGAENGIAPLNANQIIPSQYLPSYVDDILEFANKNSFPTTEEDTDPENAHNPSGPEKGKIYLAKDTGRIYRWSGSEYVEVGVIHLDYNDNGSDSNNGTAAEGTSFGTDDAMFVSSVTQLDGQIKVIHRDFAPQINYTNGTSEVAPTIRFKVAGNDSDSAAVSLNMASADNKEGNSTTFGVYGVTRLSNIPDSTSTTVAATPKGVQNAIDLLDYNDDDNDTNNVNEDLTTGDDFGADNSKFVSKVKQVDGKIEVIHRSFSPTLNLSAGTTSLAPQFNLTVGGNSEGAQSLSIASDGENGIYGVTKLNSATVIKDNSNNDILSTDNTLAVTALGVKNAIGYLDKADTAVNTDYVSAVSEADGIINVSRASFNPAITSIASTENAAQQLNISVAGNTMAQSISLDTASNIKYGVVKMSDDSSNVAMTENSVQAIIDDLNLGTVITKNVSASGDASTNEVVLGNDSRLGAMELLETFLENFEFELSMPTSVTWTVDENTNVLSAVVDSYADSTTVTIQKQNGSNWVTYSGGIRNEGDKFRAYCTRNLQFNSKNYTKSSVINPEYIEPAPEEP